MNDPDPLRTSGRRASTAERLRVDWVDLSAVPGLAAAPGRLGMTSLPGKRRKDQPGDDNPRENDPDDRGPDLEADAAHLRDRHRADTLLLLVEDRELEAAHLTGFAEAIARHGIELVRHPVRDMDVPADRTAYRATLDGVLERIRAGRTVVVACHGGLGRTGTAVACLLRDGGLDVDAAIRLTRASRPGTIERSTQVDFVRAWGRPA